jgi:hypothetical protein
MTYHLSRCFAELSSFRKFGFCLSLLALLIASGCKKPEGPPPPVSLEQLPSALEKAFAKGKPEAGEPLGALQTALRDKDYPKALMAMQAVAALPGSIKSRPTWLLPASSVSITPCKRPKARATKTPRKHFRRTGPQNSRATRGRIGRKQTQ